jgi:hypothetical protein
MVLTPNESFVFGRILAPILIAGLMYIAFQMFSGMGESIAKYLRGDDEPEKKKNDQAAQEREFDTGLVWLRLQSGLTISDEQQELVGLTDEQLLAVYDHYSSPFMAGSIGMEVSNQDMPTLAELLDITEPE